MILVGIVLFLSTQVYSYPSYNFIKVLLLVSVILITLTLAVFMPSIRYTQACPYAICKNDEADLSIEAHQIAQLGIWKLDLAENTLYCSETVYSIFEVKPYEVDLTYESFLNFIYPDDRDLWSKGFSESVKNKIHYEIDHRLLLKSRQVKWVREQGKTYYDKSGVPLYSISTVMDITKQKRNEETLKQNRIMLKRNKETFESINRELQGICKELMIAKEKAEESERLKSAFLANLSYEIRTPMNVIVGFSELIDNETLSIEKKHSFIKIINNSATYLLHIADDLLDVSKKESGNLKIAEVSGSVSEMLNETLDIYKAFNDYNLHKPISISIENRLLNGQDHIYTDFVRIKQVLSNLLINVLKFTENGDIVCGCRLSDPNTLLFYVNDTGIGIPKEKLPIILERFRQVDDSYLNREFRGTGLGLSISKGIVELMNGKIWVESKQDKGSTFCFTIPYKPGKNLNPRQ
jgi:signal transduction histidine kinase